MYVCCVDGPFVGCIVIQIVILPVILCGNENWSLALKIEQRFRRVLEQGTRVFGPKREQKWYDGRYM